jgi:hypothetical protein
MWQRHDEIVLMQPYTGNVGQRVEGHLACLEKRAPEPGEKRGGFGCVCSCGWSAQADRRKLIERMRHRHLTDMVEQGAPVVRAGIARRD